MIDTDKYEGHTPVVAWRMALSAMRNTNIADAQLIADAPLLLEEVKDLQKKLDSLREYCHAEGYDIFNWEVKNIEVIE